MTVTVAVTYTFVVEADDDHVRTVSAAVEEYIHSTKDALSDPEKIEVLDA
jgi:hypothetical protein